MSAIAEIANGLSDAERKALSPFAFFSNAVGVSLVAKGLMCSNDGVFTTAELGLAVRRFLTEDQP